MTDAFATARLDARPLAPGDRDLYVGLYTDAALMRLVAAPLAVDVAQRRFAQCLASRDAADAHAGVWVLVERESGGEIGLLGLARTGGAGEIGALLLPLWQARGFAAEAIASLVDRAFAADATLARLHTRHAAANAGADGLMAKLGFARQATASPALPCGWELLRMHWARRAVPTPAVA